MHAPRWSAVLVFAAACAATAPVPESAEELPSLSRPTASPDVLRGERLLAEGRIGEAKEIFEAALINDPDDARAWLDLGLALEETDDWTDAERAYRKAAELDPGFAEAFNNLGVLLREGGDLAGATEFLERAVALDPSLGAARFNLALAYEEQGRFERAEREYLETIERLPNDPIPRINLAMMWLDRGRPEDAVGQLRIARTLLGGNVLLSIAVGEGFRRSGQPELAISVLQEALERASEPPPTALLAELALAHYASGDLVQAERMMRRAVGQDERDPALQYAYGSILARQGQLGKARAHLRRAIALNPDGPYAKRARARLEALKR